MSTAFFPGFEQQVSTVQPETLNPSRPPFEQRGNFPISNRRIPDEFISTEATSVFKTELSKGVASTDTLASRHPCRDEVSRFQIAKPPAARVSAMADKTTATIVTAPIGVTHVCADSHRPRSVRAIDFQVQAFIRSLSPQERTTVALRPRFRNLPWIRPAWQDDSDQLP